MRRYIQTAIAVLLGTMALSAQPQAEKPTLTTDSLKKAARLKTLQAQRNDLKKQIKAEDAKRNRRIPGVAPETMEAMNDRQDSICLALRSTLTAVTLEIKELSPTQNINPDKVRHFINNRKDTTNNQQK